MPRSRTPRTVWRTRSVLPLGKLPAAATSPPDRLPAVSSSRNALRRSSGMAGTRLLAVEPSGKTVSAHRWASIFSRCDLPLPKNPLTHAACWLVCAKFLRNDSTILAIPSAYCPSHTKVRSSAWSSAMARSSRLSSDPHLPLVYERLGRIALKQLLNRHTVSPVPCKVIGMAM